MYENKNFPNLFWPIIFIGVGALLLLSNLEVIDPIDANVLWQLWPVFLVIVGVNLLFGRSNRVLAGMVSAVLALAIVAFLFFSPTIVESLPTPQMQTETFEIPLEGAESAEVHLDFDRGNLTVNELSGGANLFEAVVNHNERVTFNSSGTSQQNIRLALNNINSFRIGDLVSDQRVTGEVWFAPGLPLDVDIEIGSGSADLNLAALEITKLHAKSGSGGLDIILPGGEFSADLGSGSGSIKIETAEDSVLDLKANVGSGKITIWVAEGNSGSLELDSGSGGITVVVPEGMAVQVRGETGSGGVNLPREFVRTAGEDSVVGDSGTWETPGFAEADAKLYIRFEVGSGSLRVEYP